MADDDQQAPPQRYWFPYWTSPPVPAAPRPALRPQPSRRDTRTAAPQPPLVTASPSRRQPQQAASKGAGPPQAQPQPTRLSSRPSPSRAHPLTPIGEPNRGAQPLAPASAPKETKPQVKPATPPQPEVPKELDIIVPREKIIHEPPSDAKAHSAAVEKEKEKKEKEKDKKEHKDKDGKEKKEKEKEHKDRKEKEKEHKDRKEKEKEHKEKEKEHKEKKEKDKHKEEHDESKHHGGKLHKELKAGVADMVHKLGATAAPSAGHHERHASRTGTTVITLAGENKGASMKVSHGDQVESKDAAAGKERRARKLDEGKQEARHGAKGLTAFVNSNVQVVNNSLVLQSSCSSNDPGVHLKLSTKSKKKAEGEEAGGKSGAAAAAKKK